MKKITKTNFQGLRQLFPVLEKEDMRHYVGGYSNGYWNGNWNNPYSYFDYGG
ncbi:TIGR04149 family rSAM-modified RiPP, partial [Bacteroides thetaiotaomicron]